MKKLGNLAILASLMVLGVGVATLGLTGCAKDIGGPDGDPDNQTPITSDYKISNNLTQTAGSVMAVTITPKAGKSPGVVTVLYNGSATIPQTAGSYPVTFNVAAAEGWNAASGLSAGTLKVNTKATPTITTWPTAATITYGAALSTSALTGGTASVNGTFAWSNGATIPTVTNSGYEATFTPTDTVNYNTVMGNVNITVNKATGAVVNAPTAVSKTYNRININAVTASTEQLIEYAISTASNETGLSAWQKNTVFTDLNANTTYYIYARSIANDNYNTGTASVSEAITTAQTGTAEVYYWVNQHDSLVTTSGGATTVAPGATLTITAQDTGYSNQQWYLNGVNTGHSGNTYIFSGTITGKHTVELFVEKDGKLYNTGITITVQ